MKRLMLAAALAATTPALADDAGTKVQENKRALDRATTENPGALVGVKPGDFTPTFQANALEDTPFGVNPDALKAPVAVDTGALDALLQNVHEDALKAAEVLPKINAVGCPVLEETENQNIPDEDPYAGQRFTF